MIPVINEHGAQPFAATKVKDCFFYIHPNRLNRMCPALPHSTGEQLANILNDFKSCESLYLETKACECIFLNILTLLTCDCSSLWNRSGEDVIPSGSIDLWVALLLSGCPRCRAFTAAALTIALTNNIQHGNETEEFWERKEKQIKQRNKL